MHKRIFLVCALIGAVGRGQEALGADLDGHNQDRLERMPITTSWSGAYAGLSVGGYGIGFGVDRGGSEFDAAESGMGAGGYFGYNFGTPFVNYGGGHWMFGVEGDLNWAGLEAGKTDAALGRAAVEGSWVGSLRARGGYAWQKFYLYGTAGLAVSDISVETGAKDGGDDIRLGLAAGIGIEYRIDEHWMARLDSMIYAFGEKDLEFANGKEDTGLSYGAIRFGVGYKF